MSIVDNQHSIIKRRLVACLFVFLCGLVSLSFAARSESTVLRHGPSSARAPAVANEPQALSAPYPNCRYGSIPQLNPITDYDTASINLGWYLTYPSTSPPKPNGVLPVFFVFLKGRDCSWPGCPSPDYWDEAVINPWGEDGEALGRLVDANPGNIWLVGNEPDRTYYMDDVLPSQYAQAYHKVYTLIKEQDPSAQVGIGGVVVPSPLRLRYLDMILDEYLDRYGSPMPVDIWNTHLHIVREVKDDWGADIPPGFDEETGTLFSKSDHANVEVFKQLVIDYRTWMEARGQQDKPLIITEFGILWPRWLDDENGVPFDEPRVVSFMQATMSWLDTYADPALGYPADDYRLVQRWNWYSLDDDRTWESDDPYHYRWNGWLFSSDTYERSVFGDAFATHTGGLAPARDLVAYRFRTDPPISAVTHPTETVTVTLQLDIANPGNVSIDDPFEVAFYERLGGTTDLPYLIGSTTITSSVPGCAGVATAQVTWATVSTGAHRISVSIDTTNQIDEQDETDNEWTGTLLIGADLVYLPLVSRR